MLSFIANMLNPEPGLRCVVYKHFLKSAVAPLCCLIILMLLLYFAGTYYTYQDSLSEMRERARSTVSEIARSEASSLNQKLEEVSRNTAYLQTVTERLFQYNYDPGMSHDDIKLERAESGFFYRDLSTLMDGATIYGSSLPSSLFISPETELNESLVHRLHVTEALDLHFQRTVDSNPNIHSVYFSTWDHSNRTYPPIFNMPDKYLSGKQDVFFKDYHLANNVNNPDRNTIWTAVYPDKDEGGLMLSSIAPVYRYGFLEGIVGVNIKLGNFTASLTSTPLIWNSKPLITNEQGTLLDLSAEAKNLLGMTTFPNAPLTGMKNLPPEALKSATSTVKSKDLLPIRKKKLFQDVIFSNADINLDNFVNGFDQVSCCVHINDDEYLLSQQNINETGWHLVMLTPMSKVTQQVTQYQSFINNLGVYFVLLTSMFFILFFVYLKNQAIRLASRVSKPVESVIEFISRLNKLDNSKPLPAMKVGIRELDRLVDSSTEIQLARSRLSVLNEELEKKNNQLKKLAATDRLTGLYNRHKLDEIITGEMAKAKRYENNFTIALLDIDHFKRVNDTYGHQVGDSILVGVSAIMRRRVRKTDIVGRWGGEEFIIILPNTSLQQAAIVLDELREQLSKSNFEPVESLTVSLGLANSNTYLCEEAILAAADAALYRAKSNGRNRLEIEHEQEKIKPAEAEAI